MLVIYFATLFLSRYKKARQAIYADSANSFEKVELD